jgi:hypothetical protein
MKSEEIQAYQCFKSASQVSQSFSSKSDRFILDAIFRTRVQRTKESIILGKSSSQSIRGHYSTCFALEKASPEQRPVLTVRSINSSIGSYKSLDSWPRQVSVFFWIEVKKFEE